MSERRLKSFSSTLACELPTAGKVGYKIYKLGNHLTIHRMSTVPTLQKIEQPETILKKRKQDNKAREDKLAKAAEAKKVSEAFILPHTS